MTRLPANRRPERPLVESVKTYATSQHTQIKFERINNTERQQIAVKATDVHGLRRQRGQWEAPKPAQRAPETPRAPETKPRTKTEPAPPPERSSTKGRPPTFAPARQVRATAPERVPVPTMPRTPQPAQSRFIPKQPPSHPVQEHSHLAAPKPQAGHDTKPRQK
jgi:hypothetical protein